MTGWGVDARKQRRGRFPPARSTLPAPWGRPDRRFHREEWRGDGGCVGSRLRLAAGGCPPCHRFGEHPLGQSLAWRTLRFSHTGPVHSAGGRPQPNRSTDCSDHDSRELQCPPSMLSARSAQKPTPSRSETRPPLVQDEAHYRRSLFVTRDRDRGHLAPCFRSDGHGDHRLHRRRGRQPSQCRAPDTCAPIHATIRSWLSRETACRARSLVGVDRGPRQSVAYLMTHPLIVNERHSANAATPRTYVRSPAMGAGGSPRRITKMSSSSGV